MTESIALENFGTYLSSQYDISRRVFSYFSLQELKICAQVCKQWKEVVELTLAKRESIEILKADERYDDPPLKTQACFVLTFSKCTGPHKNENPSAFADSSVLIQPRHNVLYREPEIGSLSAFDRTQVFVRFSNVTGGQIATGTLTKGQMETSEIKSLISLPPGTRIKAVLIFSSDRSYDPAQWLTSFIKTVQELNDDKPFSIAGGKFNSNVDIMHFVIFAGESIEAASLVMSARDEKTMNESLLGFRNKVTVMRNHVLFAFRCIARQGDSNRLRSKESIENDLICKHFPTSTVVGFYGGGEYGINYPVEDETTDEPDAKRKRSDCAEDIEHGFCTSLLYVGYRS